VLQRVVFEEDILLCLVLFHVKHLNVYLELKILQYNEHYLHMQNTDLMLFFTHCVMSQLFSDRTSDSS